MANNAGAVVELDADANGGVDIGKGGTNSTTAAAAATALGVGAADDVVHSTLNLTGGTGTLALGTPSTNTGIVHWKNAVNAFIFSQQSGTTTADYTWTWPTAQSGGAGFLLNVGATGVMGYTDPATFDLPASTDGQMLQSNAGTYESTSTLSSIVFSMAGAQSNLLFNTGSNFLLDTDTSTDHVLSASEIDSRIASDAVTLTNKTIDNDVNTLNDMPVELCVAISDESTALTTGTGKLTMRAPWAFTLTDVRSSVSTAPSGAAIIIDVNESGTTLLSTKVTIDAETAATGTVTLTGGASGSVDSVTVNAVTVTSASVPFNISLDQTATDLAANITAHTSTPDYSASAAGSVVTITPDLAGDSTNGYAVVSATTTITTTDANLSGGVTEKTSTTAATAPVISDSAIADDAELTIDIDQIGSTVAGAGAKVCLYGKRNF